MTRRTTKGFRQGLGIAFLALFAAIVLYNAFFSFSYSIGPNYKNVTVDTRVNITDSKPEILIVTVNSSITLVAGSTQLIQCNATIRDYDGHDTITNVTAVFWDNASVGVGASDDHNSHYTNSSCASTGNDGVYIANFTCNFTVYYYANASTDWVCNVTVTDMEYEFNESVSGSTDWAYNTTTILQLLALNVTNLIDYGDMGVGDISPSIQANVTNFGNMPINISVKGYARTENDGLAFNCTVGNISIENEKYGLDALADYADPSFVALSSSFDSIVGLTVLHQTVDGVPVVNETYWKLYVPPNPNGLCTGHVVFQAESATTP